MDRLEGDIRSQRISMTKLLLSNSYSIPSMAQITDAKITIKSGSSIIIEKTITNSGLVVDTPNKFIVITFNTSDFASNKLQKNKSYTIGFGIKYGALTEFVPVALTFTSSNLKVLPNPLI